MTVTYDEQPLDVHLTLDFSKVKWGDVEEYQRIHAEGTDAERTKALQDLVSRVIGQPMVDLPAPVAIEVAQHVVERLSGTGAAQKN